MALSPSDSQNNIDFQQEPDYYDGCCPLGDNIRIKIYDMFDDPTASKTSKIFSIIILLLIVLSCVSFVVETLPQFKYPEFGNKVEDTPEEFYYIEFVCIMIFTVEYMARILCCPVVDYRRIGVKEYIEWPILPSWFSKMHCFFWRPMNLIDFIAIIPFYLSLVKLGGGGFAFLRVLRLARVFRVFKLGKYNQGASLFIDVIRTSMSALSLLMFFGGITAVLFGSIVYFVEKGDWQDLCPSLAAGEKKRGCYERQDVYGTGMEQSPYTSIPQAFWWVFTTTTTVGYGDLYPTTSIGKLVAIVTMHVGIIALALPITIIGSNFSKLYAQQQHHVAAQKRMTSKQKTNIIEVGNIRLKEIAETLDTLGKEIAMIIEGNEMEMRNEQRKLEKLKEDKQHSQRINPTKHEEDMNSDE